mmetsp:Transcript_103560/g.302232  ORF Transcript_103560/g.302232 Transcript_103560/m.302232 type:complete len:290 (-) Transcript_103560:83-952(-)
MGQGNSSCCSEGKKSAVLQDKQCDIVCAQGQDEQEQTMIRLEEEIVKSGPDEGPLALPPSSTLALLLTADAQDAPSDTEPIKGAYSFRSGATYEGQWKNRSRHGFGVQRWPDGSCYEGEWADGGVQGKGRFTFQNGDVYIGQWKANSFHGLGAYRAADGVTYLGEWTHEAREGYGVEVSASSGTTKYAGAFLLDKKHGHGIYTWSDGGEYVGEMRQDIIEGYGIHRSNKGDIFKGGWRGAVKHGIGCYYMSDARTFSARYEDNKHVGLGCYTSIGPDGSKIRSFRKAES